MFSGCFDEIMVDLREIMVPLEKCVGVKVGEIETEVLDELIAHDYDQAIVLSDKGLIGGVPTDYLEELRKAKTELSPHDSMIELKEIFTPQHLLSLLEFFEENRFGFVCIEQDAEEKGTYLFTLGMVTLSDLNRRYIRSIIYNMVAELEVLLAKCIKSNYPDVQIWLDYLGEESLVKILGYWELAKRRHIDIGPIEACMLADLLNIVAKDIRILRAIGYKSKSEYKSATGKICDLRNRVMHPIRPLIIDAMDVRSTGETIFHIANLSTRLLNVMPCT